VRPTCLLLVFCISLSLLGQDTVRVLFLYGSKPKAKGEPRLFGGIHGGHVSVEYGSGYASFIPKGKLHIFNKDQFHSRFVTETANSFVYDTTDSRYMIMSIPVTAVQKRALDSVIAKRLRRSPYDYAFFGMRCASAAYEILSSAHIFPGISRHAMVRRFFYPKKLRKMMLREAKRNKWSIIYRPGKTTRKWESD
jgi:hypothetical protein